jgi:DNA-binding NtrC family response regulator
MSARTNTVVIIDDEPAAADALAVIIRDWGADVAVGSNARPIAEQLGSRVNEVGWIITDFNLGPGPDGVALAQEFASAAPGAKVLVLSGSFHGRATAAAAKAGYEIMQKPARAEMIVSWLERA